MDDLISDWALDEHVEIRSDRKGELDEVVTHDAGMFHLERMSNRSIWMAIYHPEDGKDSRVIVSISAVKGPDGEPVLAMEVEIE